MIDDDNIMDSRDSHRMGEHMVNQKMDLLNNDMRQQLTTNIDMKRRMRQRMIDKNAAKKALFDLKEDKDGGKDPAHARIERANRNQTKMPPENFKQDLGYDPFHCETLSS